jgi:lipopolysaccharide transport system ATP-binding protein
MVPAIRVEGLGKRYRLAGGGDPRSRYRTLRESLVEAVKAPFRRAARGGKVGAGDFWALSDVAFEVQPGEVVGIIGRNGAGKSTLLKVLSRITKPTTGRVEINGRVGSLLEVGTGFHPELTGRENIYLNGSILGMSRREIDRKFDEIVAFAEVEQFLDTPVKRYSSGMYVRLAFAVAAHLEPEILVVDEVLAVGDAAFQKKCTGKMGEVSRHGRTVLFVSHNMAAVQSLCERCILLKAGRVEQDGEADAVADYYLRSAMEVEGNGDADLRTAHRTMGDQAVRFTRVTLRNTVGQVTTTFRLGEPIRMTLELESDIRHDAGEVGFSVRTLTDVLLFTSSSTDRKPPLLVRPGVFRLEAVIDPNYLRPGPYWLQVGTTCGTERDVIPEAIQFTIDDSRHYSDTPLLRLPGHLYFPFSWSGIGERGEVTGFHQSELVPAERACPVGGV